jgi:psiF repeat
LSARKQRRALPPLPGDKHSAPIRRGNHAHVPEKTSHKDLTMKHLITALALTFAATASFAAAHTGAAPMAKPTQQSKMGECNKEAGDKKGADRKTFMKTCLSAKKASQQDKMKACNKDATGKKGDERKAFMKTCLSA